MRRERLQSDVNSHLAWLILIAILVPRCFTSCKTNDGASPKVNANARVLLFSGAGTSPGDLAALKKVLESERLEYSTADSVQMNAMSETQLLEYRLLIVPGGNFEQIGNSLNSGTSTKIRNAVRNGLNYLGVCAGAFFAGDSPYNGLNLTSGTRFGFYAAESQGIRKSAVTIKDAEGRTLDQYWEDGPDLTGWGAVIAKYPDGNPAIVQATFGKGSVILTGVHPEAPESWRAGMQFGTPVNTDNTYAAKLIRAALTRESLPHF